MAEASIILLPADAMTIASGSPVAATNPAAEGIFAGMLAQRLQPQTAIDAPTGSLVRAGESSAASPATVVQTALNTAANSGQASPQTGKALPPGSELGQAKGEAATTEPAELALMGLAEADNPPPLLTGDESTPLTLALPLALTASVVPSSAESSAEAALPGGVVDTASQALLAAGVAPIANPALPGAELNGAARPVVDPLRPELQRPQADTVLTLAKARQVTTDVAQERARQPAASLGLNLPSYATGESLRSNNVAMATAQAIRSRSAETPVNQAVNGESLSRQFQQQIDRLLMTARASAAAPATTSLFSTPSVDSLVGTPVDASLSTLIPSFSTDLRPAAPLGVLSGMSVPVATPVGQPGWSADLAQRMVWLANQDIREAQIQLNPRNLGPIDVRIVYSDTQQLSVSFNAQNPAAREALDAALPRLREMFEQQGLSLGDASVSQESFAHQQQARDDHDGFSSSASGGAVSQSGEIPEGDAVLRPPPVILGTGLLDTFA